MNARGNGRGWGRGYDRFNAYGYNAPHYGYTPYGYGAPVAAPYGYPLAPAAPVGPQAPSPSKTHSHFCAVAQKDEKGPCRGLFRLSPGSLAPRP